MWPDIAEFCIKWRLHTCLTNSASLMWSNPITIPGFLRNFEYNKFTDLNFSEGHTQVKYRHYNIYHDKTNFKYIIVKMRVKRSCYFLFPYYQTKTKIFPGWKMTELFSRFRRNPAILFLLYQQIILTSYSRTIWSSLLGEQPVAQPAQNLGRSRFLTLGHQQCLLWDTTSQSTKQRNML